MSILDEVKICPDCGEFPCVCDFEDGHQDSTVEEDPDGLL